MKTQIVRTIICVVFLAMMPAVSAQDHSGVERPRVGLVLGGGGARGAAHIGVLQELERMRIPVDAIAGTSMGAIVGGLYASGMTADELRELVVSIDWVEAFNDDSQRKNRRYRRKQDDAAFPMQFELGMRDRQLQMPMGLVQGQNLGLILREQTLSVTHIENFDELPVPFHAVASDIETGDIHIMSSGDLALAIRASMSAPGVFSPVKVDGRTLVDGGLVGNVPVEVIKSMQVDIVIAVDVEFPLYELDELQSALTITEQMLTILVNKETSRQLEKLSDDDILIRPDLGSYGSGNFADVEDTIEPGAQAVIEMAQRLQALALDEQSYQAHLARRLGKRDQVDVLDFVRVADNSRLSEKVLTSLLRTRPGDPVNAFQLANDAARLHGLDIYEQVDYRLVTENDQTGVEFTTRQKSWGPNFLQFGILIEDDFEGQTAFNLAARMTRPGVNALGGEWRNDLQIGTDPYLFSEFYQPLSFDSRYFVAPRIQLQQTNFNVFLDGENVARYRVGEGGLSLDIGRELGLWGEFRIGAFRGSGNAKVKVGPPDFPTIDFNTGGVVTRFNIDTLDNAQFPLSGSRVAVEWIISRPGMGADFRYDSIESSISHAWTHGRHTLNAGLVFNTTVDSDNMVQNFFPLGGFLQLSGLARGEISGPHAGVARLVYYRRSGATARGVFDMPLYLGASLEAGNVWQSRSDISSESLLINGSLFAGIDTYFGPLFLAAGFAEGGRSSFYLMLGQPR